MSVNPDLTARDRGIWDTLRVRDLRSWDLTTAIQDYDVHLISHGSLYN